MARATLEMFLKLTGADKTSRGLDKVSNSSKKLDSNVKNSTKSNAQFSAGMSGLGKGAIAGASIIAGKALVDFARESVMAASSAQEAAGAFGTTFGDAAANLTKELQKNANLFGLTTSEAQQLIGVFGAVAQGMGFTQDESADLSSRLFELSGDIASFNNISAGAEPVLRAFQSAIVGEREALKTYGIAISEAEVQTKAFEMTGKTSADALTRQEKALATTELLFEKASVQIGNAEREAEGFAAQMLQTRAATTELKEEVGEELLPAAAVLLGTFNDFVDTVAPAVVGAFGLVGDAIVATSKVTDAANDAFTDFIKRYILGQRVIKDEEGAIDDFNKAVEENTEVLNENSIQVIGTTGFTQEYLHFINQGSQLYRDYNKEIKENRTNMLITTAQIVKYNKAQRELNLEVFNGNKLVAESIDLELDKFRILDLITSSNSNVKKAEQDRAKAIKDVEELQIAENIADAEAAKTKAQLLTEIRLLEKAEEDGKDVAIDLALARANLAEAEFELANESDNLVRAREILEIAEANLTQAIDNQTEAFQKRNDVLIDSLDLTARQTIENQKLAESFRLLDPMSLVGLPVGAPTQIAPTEIPSIPVQDFRTQLAGGLQQTSTVDVNLNLTDAIGEIIQRENIKIQERGNTFVLEG